MIALRSVKLTQLRSAITFLLGPRSRSIHVLRLYEVSNRSLNRDVIPNPGLSLYGV